MTPLPACVQAGHGSAYITLESRQPEQWNSKDAPSHWHLLVFSTNHFLTDPHLRFRRCQSQAQHRNNTVSRETQRGWRHPCKTHTYMDTITWQDLIVIGRLSEALTGMMELTITHQGCKSGLIPPDTLLSHRHFNHMLTPLRATSYYMLVTSFLLLIQAPTLCVSFGLAGNNWSCGCNPGVNPKLSPWQGIKMTMWPNSHACTHTHTHTDTHTHLLSPHLSSTLNVSVPHPGLSLSPQGVTQTLSHT